ncbi:MAG TPA: sigma-70 family RNA polymerase sigma factor [Kofleriaceae bacterium]
MDGRKAQLVERHLGLARRAAAVIHPRVKDHVAFEEVVALANAGLAEAAERFDPARGASFATFAWYRVHGTIIDGLRKATQLPRRTWARLLALRAASEYLEHRGERDRTAAERGAPALGSDALGAVALAMSAVRTMYVLSLEALRDRGFDAAGEAPAPSDGLDRAQTAARLREAIGRLPDKQRAIVTKHYFEGKSLLEAGIELGMSKSWASRLHAQAVDRLRAQVDGDAG